MNANLQAFLDMIAFSELGPDILEQSDNGYDVLVGSTANDVHLFDSYHDHPRKLIKLTIKHKDGSRSIVESTAAGRYQVLEKYYDHYRMQLGLPDFGPESQDAIAIQLIRECRAMPFIEIGDFDKAVTLCSSRWASLPAAGYGQHENDMADLRAAYLEAGGTLA